MDRKAEREKIEKILKDSGVEEKVEQLMEEWSEETGKSVQEIAQVGRVVSVVAFIKREKLEETSIPKIYKKFCDYIVLDVPLCEFIDILTRAVTDGLLEINENRHLSLTEQGEMVASLHESLAE